MAYIDHAPWVEFLTNVRLAEQELGNSSILWYRGVCDQKFQLLPSLLRRSNGLQKERELFNRYKVVATLVHEERRSDWQYLFDMQHYRLPTRLVDWTEVLGIAVFFALLGSLDVDAAVYVLNPLALNKSSSKDDLVSVYDDPTFDYKTVYWEHKPFPPVAPIAVQVPAQNSRIAAQRGKFTVHGTDKRPIELQFPDFVKKVRLERRMKAAAREFLAAAGINEFSVFPDIVGLAAFLEAIVGIQP
jgi:hypothetical protein